MAGLCIAIVMCMGTGKQLLLLLAFTFIGTNAYSALMPVTQVYTVSEKNGEIIEAINILDWIEAYNAITTARNDFDINNFVSVDKMERGMSQSDLGLNILLTTLDNLESDTVVIVKEALKSVDDVASAKIVTKDNAEMKMKVDLIKSEAKLEYHGEVDAVLTYKIASADAHFELSKDFSGTRLVAEHTVSGSEYKNLVGVRWNF